MHHLKPALKSSVFALGFAALWLTSPLTFADESVMSSDSSHDSSRVNSQPGQAEVVANTERDGMARSMNQTAIERHSTAARSDSDKASDRMKSSAQQNLAPHTLMMESSLMSAMDQVKGLRTQLKVAERPSSEFVEHFQTYGKEISADLSTAQAHQKHLQTGAQRFPDLSQKEDLQSINTAFNDLRSYHQSWQSRMSQNGYWSNQKQVMNDLDGLEKRVNQALDRTKTFNSSDLDVANVG